MDVLEQLKREKYALNYAIVGIQGVWSQGYDAMGIEFKENLDSNIMERVGYPLDVFMNTRFKMSKLGLPVKNRMAFQAVGSAKEIINSDDQLWGALHRDPTIRVLKHVRDGVFHGNEFTFEGKEPRFDAEWQGFEITEDLEGENVYTDVEGDLDQRDQNLRLTNGVMEYGDAFALLDSVISIVERKTGEADDDDVI
jgi:hypothetical protein